MTKKKMIKIQIHSMVDVITNSSTTIFIHQNVVDEAKVVISEVLKLAEIDKTPDDVFYFGVFPSDDAIIEYIEDSEYELYETMPIPYITAPYRDPERAAQIKVREQWLNDLKRKIIMGEIDCPKWADIESDLILYIEPKEEKFKPIAEAIKKMLNGVEAEDYDNS